MARARHGFLPWMLIMGFILSCGVPFAAQVPIPTALPGAVDIIVAQTAGAAATQTAALIPPSLTPSITPPPTSTPSETPTPTLTFVFRLPTSTKVRTSTPVPTSGSSGGGGGGGGGGTSDYDCSLVSRTPANGAVFNGGNTFTENWKVKNIGSLKWTTTNVDFIYVSGENMSAISGFDLPSPVNPGAMITLSVNMTAPSAPGTHTTTWALRAGKIQFCSVSLSITVN
jgi:hypothetical protein